MKSSQRHYATVAYDKISALQEQCNDRQTVQQYGQLCHRFPSLVLTNGLRLAVAFFQSKCQEDDDQKKNVAFRLFLEHLGLAVGHCFTLNCEKNIPEGADYLNLSRQVLSASVWFKRYAEAILNVSQGDKSLEEDTQASDGRTSKEDRV